jgi:uncharacterized protein YegJ (DUF2314 family)
VVSRDGQPDVVNFAPDDQAMNAAIAQAQKTVGDFITDMEIRKNSAAERTLKVRFETDAGAEHIWVGEVGISGKTFSGRLKNEPLNIKNLKYGDAVTFSREQISDWLIVSDGKVRGGFTIKVARKQLPAEEQRAFDEETGGAFKE